ncbi:AAA family ATPase [Olivibacter sp. SDN3]|uniref:AAA family ATPase n=1 Tax=Olivibacter sp. SDN3 TaxID=2764720 RepID=UPI00165120D9|nr:AAA family ATPase [Olivibacter sp. SDN3]QNL48141.1 AAA family ATPase [Olivibacter sp. SDN3]
MENLIIKNFGPIINAQIELKRINIFIGTTSSGKSTVAKLATIFKSGQFAVSNNPFGEFKKLLSNYNIEYNIGSDTYIGFEHDSYTYEIKNNSFIINTSHFDQPRLNAIYIPAERVFFSTLSQSIFSLINSDIALPKWLIDFGAKFEKARSAIKTFPIDFLNAKYELRDGTDYIVLPNQTAIKLAQASSGIQSILPLLLVVEYNTKNTKNGGDDLFVIEEPELNLYPSSQKDLIEFIIEKINASEDQLIITTHSPYLLTSIDNLIQANNVAEHRSEVKEAVEKLVPFPQWVNFEKVACYFFDEGTAKSTLDEELQSIGPSNIDDVSGTISETFEKLLTLKYAE